MRITFSNQSFSVFFFIWYYFHFCLAEKTANKIVFNLQTVSFLFKTSLASVLSPTSDSQFLLPYDLVWKRNSSSSSLGLGLISVAFNLAWIGSIFLFLCTMFHNFQGTSYLFGVAWMSILAEQCKFTPKCRFNRIFFALTECNDWPI